MAWECFWVEPSHRCRVYLRRYRSSTRNEAGALVDPCPAVVSDYSYCDARRFFCEAPASQRDDGIWERPEVRNPSREDSRWPRWCDACGRPMADGDEWQVFVEYLYRRAGTGQEWSQAGLPAGAMWDGAWWPDKGDDGVSLFVKLPPGGAGDVWNVDAVRDGQRVWTRTGEPPGVTADPSILSPNYHGWLRSGELSDSLPDRPL